MGCLCLLAEEHLSRWLQAKSVGELDAAVDRPIGDVAAAGIVMVGILAHVDVRRGWIKLFGYRTGGRLT